MEDQYGVVQRDIPKILEAIEEAGKLPLGVCKLQEEDQKPITPCGQRVHRGNGSVKSLLKCK